MPQAPFDFTARKLPYGYLVRTTTVDVRPSDSGSKKRILSIARITRVLDYLFGLLYALLLVRLLLEFVSARRASGFFQSIRELTDPLYAPFNHIVVTGSIGGAPIIWSLVIAVFGYVLLQVALHGLLRLVARG